MRPEEEAANGETTTATPPPSFLFLIENARAGRMENAHFLSETVPAFSAFFFLLLLTVSSASEFTIIYIDI